MATYDFTESTKAGSEYREPKFGTPLNRSALKRMDEAWDPTFQRIYRITEGLEKPVPTPWKGLNKALNGGLWPGLTMLVGNSSAGKSQFSIQLAYEAVSNGFPTAYIMLEGSVDALNCRISGLVTHKPWSDILRGKLPVTEIKHIQQTGLKAIQGKPFHVVEGPPYQFSYNELENVIKELKECYIQETSFKEGVAQKPILVILDYLQLIGGNNGFRSDDVRSRIQQAAYGCYRLARENHAVIITISSTARAHYEILNGKVKRNRAGEPLEPLLGEGDPDRLMGLGKESGETEYGSDNVLVLCQNKEDVQHPLSKWIAIAKQRAGKRTWIPVTFDGCRFTEKIASSLYNPYSG